MENPIDANNKHLSQTLGSSSFQPNPDAEVLKLQEEVQELQDRIAKLEEQGRVLKSLFDSLEGKETRVSRWKRILFSPRRRKTA